LKSFRKPWQKSGKAISAKRDGSGGRIKQGRKYTPNLLSVWRKSDLLSLSGKAL